MKSLRKLMSLLGGLALGSVSFLSPAQAADRAPDFSGKSIEVIVGTSPGGTTDFLARLMLTYLVKYLPGSPTPIIQNRPGAHSLTALNYFTEAAKTDGLMLAAGSITELDPTTYRLPQSRFNPANLAMIGAGEIGGGVLGIRASALPRLTDPHANPVEMATVAGFPHVTMLMAAWGRRYLGWNLQWVPGYPSDANSLILALERGEVDMTSFSATTLTPTLLDTSKFSILYQTGSERGRKPSNLKSIANTPLFRTAVEDRLDTPLAHKAFDYWSDSSSVAIWLALPKATPPAIVDAYRKAFSDMQSDAKFLEQGRTFSADFALWPADGVSKVVDDFAGVSDDVLNFMPKLLREQGLHFD